MRKVTDNNSFLKRVEELVGNDYVPMSIYSGRHSKVKMMHSTCGYVWYVEAGAFLGSRGKTGSRCPVCYGNVKKTTESFKEELFNKFGDDYELISEYQNAHTKVEIKHHVCGRTYKVVPMSVSKGYSCPYCSGNLVDNSVMDDKINKVSLGEYTRVSEYTRAFDKIDIRHNVCGNVFKTTGAKLDVYGLPRCPKCYYSFGEAYIASYLKANDIKYTYQKSFDDLKNINRLSYDFLIDDYGILIEYQGKQHYGPVDIFGGIEGYETQVKIDNKKREYAKSHNLSILEVPYLYDNYIKVTNFLNSNLKVNQSGPNQI